MVITMIRKALQIILAITLLHLGNSALAFTLIVPQEQVSPSNTITDSTTLDTQIQSIASAIRAHLFSLRRTHESKKTAQYGGILAANSHVDSVGDWNGVTLAYNDLAAAEGGGVSDGGGNATKGLWITSAYSALKNDFARTNFDGDTQNILGGFDFTLSDKYILGVAVSHETSRFNTKFNIGNEKTTGFNVSPYVAVLLSDAWSVDLSLGHGKFNTSQSRLFVISPVIESEFASTRDFVSTNLTNVSSWGNVKLTGSAGYIAAKQEQEAFVESNGNMVSSSSQTSKQWNLAVDAAYNHGESESFVGAIYEKSRKPETVQFATGEQPPDDRDSYLVSAGWRYFGKGLVANVVFSSRLGQENVTEYGFSTMIRADF
jgi:hypothetical protein